MDCLVISGVCCGTKGKRQGRSKSLAVGVHDLMELRRERLPRSQTAGVADSRGRNSLKEQYNTDGHRRALRRVKSFHNSIRVAREAKESVENAAHQQLMESRKRDVRSRQIRRNEIYALNTILSHVDDKKQYLYSNGLLDSINGGV